MANREDFKTKEIPLNGKLVIGDDPVTVGTDFVELKNIRYTDKHLTNVGGMTKINTAALGDLIDAGFFFEKDRPSSEKHLLVARTDGYIYDNTAAPPAQGNFGSAIFTNSAGAGDPRFSKAPSGKVVYCNGVDTAIWGGDEIRVDGFIDKSDDNSFSYNYLKQISNNLTDENNIAYLHNISNQIDANTSLLMHFENNLNDDGYAGGHTIAAAPNMVYTAAAYRFGAYCTEFNGVNRAFSLADHTDWDFSGGTFTIDFWYRPLDNEILNRQSIYYQQNTGDANEHIEIYFDYSGGRQRVHFELYSGGASVLHLVGNTANTTSNKQWTHIAIVESGDDYNLYVNGISKQYLSSAVRPANYTDYVYVGRTAASTYFTKAYFDELRISKGSARWTSNFSPSESAYADGNVKTSLYVGSTMALSGMNFYTVVANTTAGSATVSYWDGNGWSPVTTLAGVGATPFGSTGLNAWTFDTTVGSAKLKSIDDNIMFWYKVGISDVDSTTTLYKVTAKAPMQQITDIWDGSFRITGSFQFYDLSGVKYLDFTSNIESENFDSNNEGTYATLGGLTFDDDALYIGSFERLSGFRISFANGFSNTNQCTLYLYYWNGSSWVIANGLEDGTSSNNTSFNKSGTISWDYPDSSEEFKRVLAGQPGIGGAPAPTTPSSPTSNIELYYYKIVFVGNGTTTAFPTEGSTTGVRPFNLNLIPSPRDIGGYTFALEFAQRLWLCGEVDGDTNSAISSVIDTSQIFNGDNSLKQYFGDETSLVGGASLYARTANIISNTAIFFKKTETWALDISNDGTIIPRLLSGSIGCIAPYTIDSTDIEMSPSQYKRVAIWLSQQGIMLSDGTSPINISKDIENLFDPMSTDYLTSAVLATCRGFINPQRNEYILVVPQSTTYVFDITRKKWYEADRGGNLIGGLAVYDSNGSAYAYGFGDDYVWRLDNGNDNDGTNIACSFKLGDIALEEGSIFNRTTIKSTKLVTKALSSSANNINLYHYGDGATAADTFTVIAPTNAGKRIIENIDPNTSESNIFHSFKCSFNVNASATEFTPIFMGVNYSRDKREF